MEELDLAANNLCTTEDAFEQFQSGAMYEEDEFITLSDIVSSPHTNQDVNEILQDDPCDEVSLSIQDEEAVNNINIPPPKQNEVLNIHSQTKEQNNKNKTSTPKRRGRKKKGENSDVPQIQCQSESNKPKKPKRQSRKSFIEKDTNSELKYVEESVIEEPKGATVVTGNVCKPANKAKRKYNKSSLQKETKQQIKKQGKQAKQTVKKIQKESPNEEQNNQINNTTNEDSNINTPSVDIQKTKHKRGRKKRNISCQNVISGDTKTPPKINSIILSKKENNEIKNSIPKIPLYDETNKTSEADGKLNITINKKIKNSVSESVENYISEEDIEDLPLSNLSKKTENELNTTLEQNITNSNIHSKNKTANCKEITVKKRGRPKKINDNVPAKADLEIKKVLSETTEKLDNINDLSTQDEPNTLAINPEKTSEPVISSNSEPQVLEACEKININTESNSHAKRNSKKKIIPDFEYNVDSVVKNDKTEDTQKSNEDNESIITDDPSGRPVRRRVLKNWNYDEGSDEDPYANVESSDDEPRRRKKGGRYYSDDEYFPGNKRQLTETESDVAMDEDDIDPDNRPQKKKKSRKSDLTISNKSPRKKGRKSDAESICTTEKTNTDSGDVDFEDCYSSGMRGTDEQITPTKSKKGRKRSGKTNEFDNFIAKIVQGTDIKISKKSVDNAKTPLQIPVIEATEAKKSIEKSAQTITVNTKAACVQTDTVYEIPMKDQVPLTGEQSEKACDFLSSIVQTTAELGQLMTQKSEDFIAKKINTKYVTDTFKMDYCVKKSFLLFKLAKHNLVQMEEDLSKQYEEFLKENNLIQHRQEPKVIASTSKASDSDCEIVEEPVKNKAPPKAQKPAFNPKTVFLNKELSIKIAKKPTEEPVPKKKLNIKGRHSVWINDSVVVKKVKPNQSFLAQDSRNKKPPDNKITLEQVHDFFKTYERQKALFICAPFVRTEWFGRERKYMCNYFVDSTSDFPEKTVVMQNETVVSEVAFVDHDSSHVIGRPKPEDSIELCPQTLSLLCTKIVQNCLHPKDDTCNISKPSDLQYKNDKTHSQSHLVISDINKNIICLKPNYLQSLKTLCFKRVIELMNSAISSDAKLNLKSDNVSTCVGASYKNEMNNMIEVKKNTSNIEQIKPLLSLCIKVIQENQKSHLSRNINMPQPLKSLSFFKVQTLMNEYSIENNADSEHKFYNVQNLIQLCLDATNISLRGSNVTKDTSSEQERYNVKTLLQLCLDTKNISLHGSNIENNTSAEQKCYNVETLLQLCIDATDVSLHPNNKTDDTSTEQKKYNVKTLLQLCMEAMNISLYLNKENKTIDSETLGESKNLGEFLEQKNFQVQSGASEVMTLKSMCFNKIHEFKSEWYTRQNMLHEMESDKTTLNFTIDNVNTVSDDVFLDASDDDLGDLDNDNYFESYKNEEEQQNYSDVNCEVNYDDLGDDDNNWESQVQMQELRSCFDTPNIEIENTISGINENIGQDSILQIKIEPEEYPESESVVNSSNIKTEPADENEYTGESHNYSTMNIITKQEDVDDAQVRKEPICRQNSNSYDEELFENFVSTNKMMTALDDYGSRSDEIFSQSSQRVRRQYEPDSVDEIEVLTDTMNLLVPQNLDSNDKESSEEDEKEYKKSDKKKSEKRKGKLKKNIKELSNKGKILQKKEVFARKIKDNIRQDRNKPESSDSDPHCLKLNVQIDNEKKYNEHTKIKEKEEEKVIQCSEVDSTEKISENKSNLTLQDNKRDEESHEDNHENLADERWLSPLIDSDVPVEVLECEPILPIFDDIFKRKPKNRIIKKKINTLTSYVDRHGWKCYPINRKDSKIQANPHIQLDKLPASLIETYFKYQDVIDETAEELQVDKSTILQSLQTTSLKLSNVNDSEPKITTEINKVPDTSEIIDSSEIKLKKVQKSLSKYKAASNQNQLKNHTLDELSLSKDKAISIKNQLKKEALNELSPSKDKPTAIKSQLKKEVLDELCPSKDKPTPIKSQLKKEILDELCPTKGKPTAIKSQLKKEVLDELCPSKDKPTSIKDQLKKEALDELFPSKDKPISIKDQLKREKLDESSPSKDKPMSIENQLKKKAVDELSPSKDNLDESSPSKDKPTSIEIQLKKETLDESFPSKDKLTSIENELKKESLDELPPSEDKPNKDEYIPPIPVQSSEIDCIKKSLMNDDSDTEKAVETETTVIKIEKIEEPTYKTRSGRTVKCKIENAELWKDDLMLTADKMMNKELSLLHAPVDLKEEDDTRDPNKSHSKSAQKNASKGHTTRYRIKTDDDSSSEEEKQWFTTKEKLLKRLIKKNEDTKVDDAKRAKIVSEFIEKRGELPEKRQRARAKPRCKKKSAMERRKQIKILSRELFGVEAVYSKKYSQASTSKGRRNIRKVIDKKSLACSTVIANMEEFERKRRLTIRQAQLREELGCEEGVNVVVINDELCLEYDFENKRPVVSVHQFFTKVMKAHQYEGVKFMWDACFESASLTEAGGAGGGCILAHCMGLGKTLQVLALLHTVLTHPQVGMSRVLVCCPLSTVLNWVDEIHKWIGPVTDSIKVFELSKLKKTYERAYQLEDWYNGGGIFIIGYELFRSLTTLDPVLDCVRPTIVNKIRTALLDPGPDIIVCDEGHLLKNDCSVLALAMSRVATKRRIMLTGTPMQNNLREYYCMVNFVKPNLLGSYSEYSNRFENPIMNGQHRDSREEDIKLMKARTHILHKVLEGCLQRQEASVLYPYLPKKYEYTVFISLTKCQWDLYKHYHTHYINTKENKQSVLRNFHVLQKIWTHPLVLNNFLMKTRDDEKEPKTKAEKLDDDLEEAPEHAAPSAAAWWASTVHHHVLDQLDSSYKFLVVFRLLHECVELGDKVLIFSTSLYAMDALEFFLKRENKWTLGQEYYRLDGSVPAEVRQKWCREFNAPQNTGTKLFLISTRAGSLGLNMTAANRVIILDTSWNPAHDIQSIFRVYRFGQKKDCYIYRLVAMGTMEQKIYERSVTKQAVSCRVVDEQQIDRHYNMAELSELYRLDEVGSGVSAGLAAGVRDAALLRVAAVGEGLHAVHEHDSLLRGSSESVLPEHERNAAWMQFQQEHATTHIRNFEINVPKQSAEDTSIQPNTEKIKQDKDKESETNTGVTTSKTKKKPKRKSKNKNVEPEPQPSTSQQHLEPELEENMIKKIMNIFIKHNFHTTKSPDEISALVMNVRDVVAKAPKRGLNDVDPLTASIAKVLLEGEITCPENNTKGSNIIDEYKIVDKDIDLQERKRPRNRTDSDEEYLPDTRRRKSTTKTNRKSNESVSSDNSCVAPESETVTGTESTEIVANKEVLEKEPLVITLKKLKPSSKKTLESDQILKIIEKTCRDIDKEIKTDKKDEPIENQSSNVYETVESESLNECIEVDNCGTDNVPEEAPAAPVQPPEDESICLSDDDEPIITEPAPQNKPEVIDVEEAMKDPIPLPKSLLTNKNFIKLVARTYLSGNPMLDEDAAVLAAQYSTLKALKEVQASGKNLTSGPIHDIAMKILGRDLMKRWFVAKPNKNAAVTMLMETENLQNKTMNDIVLENSKQVENLQKPVTEVNKKRVNEVSNKPVTEVNKKPVTEVNKKPVTEVNKKPVTEVNKKPVTEVNKKPVTEVNKKPVTEVSKKPVTEVNKKPVNEVNKKPVTEVSKKPVTEVNKKPVNEVNKKPVTEVNKKPVTEVNKKLVTEINKKPEPETTTCKRIVVVRKANEAKKDTQKPSQSTSNSSDETVQLETSSTKVVPVGIFKGPVSLESEELSPEECILPDDDEVIISTPSPPPRPLPRRNSKQLIVNTVSSKESAGEQSKVQELVPMGSVSVPRPAQSKTDKQNKASLANANENSSHNKNVSTGQNVSKSDSAVNSKKNSTPCYVTISLDSDDEDAPSVVSDDDDVSKPTPESRTSIVSLPVNSERSSEIKDDEMLVDVAKPRPAPVEQRKKQIKERNVPTIIEKKCKPGDIIRISESGKVEILKRIPGVEKANQSHIDKQKDDNRNENSSKKVNRPPVTGTSSKEILAKKVSEKPTSLKEDKQKDIPSTSKQEKDPDPLSVLKNVIQIPAFRYEKTTASKPSLDKFLPIPLPSGKEVLNTKLLEMNPIITLKNTKQGISSNDKQKILNTKLIPTKSISVIKASDAPKPKEDASKELVIDLTSSQSDQVNAAPVPEEPNDVVIVGDCAEDTETNKVSSVISNPKKPTKVTVRKSISKPPPKPSIPPKAIPCTSDSKRSSPWSDSAQAKKMKTESKKMTLQDFNLDDFDDIIELE